MEDDEGLGDEDPVTPPLPPEDRLWRHPSELLSNPLPGRARRRRRPGKESRPWPVALLSGVIGALFATGLVAVTGGLRTHTDTVRVVEREVPIPVPVAAGTTILKVAERMRPMVVRVRVDGDHGQASGSGVIFRSDGHILTNDHLVAGAGSIAVVLSDGTSKPATLVGGEPETDVAVLRIDKTGLPAAPLGSAASLRAGDVIMAIGSTVSLAVVSTMGNQVPQDKGPTLLDMIQTDGPIPASSTGGALVDSSGAVVGLATVIPGGPGYAVPIDTAQDVAQQLVASGRVAHSWLGIEGGDVDADTAHQWGIDGGAVVKTVHAGSPAAQAGIAVRDVITSLDGVHVASMNGLKVALRSRRPGYTVSFTYYRAGGPHQGQATLQERPPSW